MTTGVAGGHRTLSARDQHNRRAAFVTVLAPFRDPASPGHHAPLTRRLSAPGTLSVMRLATGNLLCCLIVVAVAVGLLVAYLQRRRR